MFSRSDGAVAIGAALLAVLYIGLQLFFAPASSEWSAALEKFSIKNAAKPMDINRVSLAKLEELPGIGPILAERIMSYRLKHGPFGSLEELLDVPGIGPQTLENLRPWVRICSLSPCE